MKISLLLHFYQPHNQQDDILLRIVNESYLPLTRGLLQNPQAKIIVNINGALSKLLDLKGHHEVLHNLKTLFDRGQIELTGSAMYHPFLPLLPEKEIVRQIELNDEANRQFFGSELQKKGFFPPEMAINNKLLSVVKSQGFEWIAAPEVSYPSGHVKADKKYIHNETDLTLHFRNKRVSSLILSAVCRTSNDLIRETQDLHTDSYWFCVMDSETFGHHRIGHEKFLFDIFSNDFFEPVLSSDMYISELPIERTIIRASSWTNEEQDFWLDKEQTKPTEGKSFILWCDPENEIHKIQWELTNFVIQCLEEYKDKSAQNYLSAREALDRALASDQYWWASVKPWWSLEMVEQGAFQLKSVLSKLNADVKDVTKAEDMYRCILDIAFDWQRSGFIRKRHTQNSGTFLKNPLKERTPAEWFNQIVLEFEREMRIAAENRDFEKAIKWRDAILKINTGVDKYDILHVVDELWSGRNVPWAQPLVKPFLEHSWDELSDFVKENLKDVPNQEAFEKLKQEYEDKKKF